MSTEIVVTIIGVIGVIAAAAIGLFTNLSTKQKIKAIITIVIIAAILIVVVILIGRSFPPPPTPTPTLTATPTLTPTYTPTVTPTSTLTTTFTPTPQPETISTPAVTPTYVVRNELWTDLIEEAILTVGSQEITFVKVPAGCLDSNCFDTFWINKYEITFAEYLDCAGNAVCGVIPSRYLTDVNFYGDDKPVIRVEIYDAIDYCSDWLGGRLPTEEEWAYAARGPSGWEYTRGNELVQHHVNLCGSECNPTLTPTYEDNFSYTAPVGSFPDGYSWVGAFDMAGNVWEYTSTMRSSGNYIVRGDSWNEQRPSNVSFLERQPGRYYDTGFRCILDELPE